MSKKLYGILSILFLTILLIVGCQRLDDLDGIDAVDYQSEFAVPLFSTATTFKDLLEDFDENSVLSVDPNGLLTLTYSGDINTKSTADLYDIINDTPPFPVDTFMTLPFEAPDNIDVDYIILKTGTLNYLFQSDHEEAVDVKVILPEVTKNGVPFSDNVDNVTGLFVSSSIDLTGYRITPNNDSLSVRYICTRGNGERDTVTSFVMRITNLEFAYAEGYWGNEVQDIDRDTISIDFFDNWKAGEIYFEDPKIRMKVVNSFGFPVRSVTRLINIFTLQGDTISLESPYIDQGIDFNYPSLSEVGEIKETIFYFDKDNSNIQEVLSQTPIAVDYDIDAIANPEMDLDLRGFLLDTSSFKIEVEVELPLYGTSLGFGILDSFDLDFEGYDNVDEIEFKLVGENGIPMDLDMQLYFADGNNVVLDSLLTDDIRVLEAAPVDGDGEVTEVLEKTRFITIPADRFAKIKSTKRLLLNSTFSTYNNAQVPVKLKADQNVDIRMGMKIKVSN